jgi:hypothetical protein
MRGSRELRTVENEFWAQGTSQNRFSGQSLDVFIHTQNLTHKWNTRPLIIYAHVGRIKLPTLFFVRSDTTSDVPLMAPSSSISTWHDVIKKKLFRLFSFLINFYIDHVENWFTREKILYRMKDVWTFGRRNFFSNILMSMTYL